MVLLSVLNIIHISKQILPDNPQSQGRISARSNSVTANDLLLKLKACFVEYARRSNLGLKNRNEESKPLRQCRRIMNCVWVQLSGIQLRQSLHMEKKWQGNMLNRNTIQRVIQETSENEKEISREDTNGNVIDQLLLRKRGNGITAKRSNGDKKDSLGPPFPNSRFGK